MHEPDAQRPNRGHIPALDALRGLAILAVMAYHFNRIPAGTGAFGSALSGAFRLGGSGVDLFFVLSGFLITGILSDAKGGPSYYRDFFIRRSLRIFPLYFGALAITCILLPHAGVVIDAEAVRHQGWLWLYGTNVAQARSGSYLFGGFNHFWSLAVEEHFYLVWPIVIASCSGPAARRVCVAGIVLAAACRFAIVRGGGNAIAAYVLTPCRLDALCVGALLALAARGPNWPRWVRWAGPSAIVSGGLLAILLAKLGSSVMDQTVLIARFTLSSAFFGAVLVLAVSAGPTSPIGRVGRWRPLRTIGTYSYGLYVFHYPLLNGLDRILPGSVIATRFGHPVLGGLAYFAIATACSAILAALSWHGFENRFLRLKDRLAPKRAHHPTGIAPPPDAPRPIADRVAFDRSRSIRAVRKSMADSD